MSDKTIVIIRGLTGSGKTDLANLIVSDQEDRIMISVDDYFTQEDGSYLFKPESLKDAHAWCLSEVKSAFDEGWGVFVVHNVFSRKWEVDPYINAARSSGYRIHVVNLYDRGLNDSQLARFNDHDIHPGTIQRQRKRWDKDVYRERSAPPPPYPRQHRMYRDYRY
jgi:adenylate kinase family enzyme